MLRDGRTLRRNRLAGAGNRRVREYISKQVYFSEGRNDGVYWASEEPSVLLIHHASEAAQGLRRMATPMTACASSSGFAMEQSRVRFFRPRMCFRRGLILTRRPVAIRQKGACEH